MITNRTVTPELSACELVVLYGQGWPIHEASWGGHLRQEIGRRCPPKSNHSHPLLLLLLGRIRIEQDEPVEVFTFVQMSGELECHCCSFSACCTYTSSAPLSLSFPIQEKGGIEVGTSLGKEGRSQVLRGFELD